MRNTVLVDTGFLIALFNGKDSLHDSAKRALGALPIGTRLVTVLPCVTESCFFLDRIGKASLLKWFARGAARIRAIGEHDLPDIAGMLERYADREMDFADACLIWLSGQEQTNRILTTDRRDFDIYRTLNGGYFERLWVE